MWYLPKDYISVHERVDKFHSDHDKDISIDTHFSLEWEVAIFKAQIKTKKWTFTWSSFWQLWKEKAFERLETVAVWRALAFAWYEVKWWIASNEEIQIFNNKEEEEKEWFNDSNLESFKKVYLNYTKESAVAEARKKYKVSKAFATKIEELYEWDVFK